MLKLHLFLFVFFCFYSDATRIKDRFESLFDYNVRCSIQCPKQYKDLTFFSPKLQQILFKLRSFSRANCSLDMVEFQENGLPDENGSYDGVIGMIQRHEQDFLFKTVRPDSLPFEPGKITPPFAPADVTIISHRNESRNVTKELTDFLKVDCKIYIYSFTCLFFISSIIYSFVEVIILRRKLNMKRFRRKFFETHQKMFALLIDQKSLFPLTKTGRIITLTVSLFCLFSIHGLLLNSISADLVVTVKPPTIQSLDDLLNYPMQPVIMKTLHLIDLLKGAPQGSKYQELWNRITENEEGIFVFDFENQTASQENWQNVFKKVNNSEVAVLMANSYADIMKGIMCVFYPDKVENIAVAENFFATGVLSGLMSPKIHPYTEKVLTYCILTLLESHLLFEAFDDYKTFLADGFSSTKYNSSSIQCIEKKSENQRNKIGFTKLKFQYIRTLFKLYLIGIIVSCFAFVLEFARVELQIYQKIEMEKRQKIAKYRLLKRAFVEKNSRQSSCRK